MVGFPLPAAPGPNKQLIITGNAAGGPSTLEYSVVHEAESESSSSVDCSVNSVSSTAAVRRSASAGVGRGAPTSSVDTKEGDCGASGEDRRSLEHDSGEEGTASSSACNDRCFS